MTSPNNHDIPDKYDITLMNHEMVINIVATATTALLKMASSVLHN
jgi:hypothetical protein